jgi:hypothetical protein
MKSTQNVFQTPHKNAGVIKTMKNVSKTIQTIANQFRTHENHIQNFPHSYGSAPASTQTNKTHPEHLLAHNKCMTHTQRHTANARTKTTNLVYSTKILCGYQPLNGTTASGLARTFRLGLNRTVRDRKMGKKTISNNIACL